MGSCSSSKKNPVIKADVVPSSTEPASQLAGDAQPVAKKAVKPSKPPKRATAGGNPDKKIVMPDGAVADVEGYTINPSEDYFNRYDSSCTTILNNELSALKRCLELVKETDMFSDPDFDPDKNGPQLMYYSGEPPAPGYTDPARVEWRRPREWAPNSAFFSGGISSNDVVQGALGDCWFIGALSTLATRDKLLCGSIRRLTSGDLIKTKLDVVGLGKGVYPPIFHPFAQKGLYCLKFFVNSGWRYVIIDDRLAVHTGQNNLVFAHCLNPDEIWVPLIEKAYAKIFGSYEALNSGLIDDALVDMTGLVAEKMKLKRIKGNSAKLEEFWNKIWNFRKNKTLMGCSIEGHTEGEVRWDGERTGLLSGHAYSLVDVLHYEEPSGPDGVYRLLRIRNPWGKMEWIGPWANGSDELSDYKDGVMKEVNKLGPDEKFDPFDRNDGTFLMEILDWSEIYHNVFACVDFPDYWSGVRFRSGWTATSSGGVPKGPKDFKKWATNPQFILEAEEDCEIFISLQQEDGRLVRGSKFPYPNSIKACCFALARLDEEPKCAQFNQKQIVTLSTVKPHREVSKRIKIQAGRYSIVPATMKAGDVAPFVLAVYYSCHAEQISVFEADTEDTGALIKEEQEVETSRLNPDMVGIQRLVQNLLNA